LTFLEPVQIEQEQRQGPAVPPAPPDLPVERLVEHAPVRERGQRVGAGGALGRLVGLHLHDLRVEEAPLDVREEIHGGDPQARVAPQPGREVAPVVEDVPEEPLGLPVVHLQVKEDPDRVGEDRPPFDVAEAREAGQPGLRFGVVFREKVDQLAAGLFPQP
jgi:hypothetical protein